MTGVSALSGPVPPGLRVAFLVLTVVVIGFAVFAAVRGVWFVTVICGVFALLNLAALWTTRRAAARD
jgi:uncharacterized membrane protein